MVATPSLPVTLRRWIGWHALLQVTGLGLAVWLREAYPLWLAGLLSFLAGFWYNRAHWQAAGRWGGPANLVTTTRLLLLVLVANLPLLKLNPWLVGSLIGAAAAMDGLDGYFARRFQAQTLFGEYYDKELDAWFVLLGGYLLWLRTGVPAWVLLPGLLRYAYVGVRQLLPLGQQREPRFRWGRVFAIVMMVAIPVAWVLPLPGRISLMALASGLIGYSFARSFRWLWLAYRHPDQDPGVLLARPPRAWAWTRGHLLPWIWPLLLTLLLQVLLFIPQTTLSIEAVEGLPWQLNLAADAPPWWLSRANADWFRWWGELWLIGVLVLWLRPRRPVWYLAVALLVPLLIVYQGYYIGSIQLYGAHPYFLNDLALLREVVPLFLDQVLGQNWGYVTMAGLAGLFGVALVASLAWDWARALRRLPRWASWLWTLAGLPFLWLTWESQDLEQRSEWHTARWLLPDILQSARMPTGGVIVQLPEEVKQYESYFEEQLLEKPDVYWIFFESYGKAVAEDQELAAPYEQLMDSLTQRWSQRGWHSYSQYSNAPVKGGRSWLAFTSALAGIRLENHLLYNDLIERFYAFPHAIRWFSKQGYQTLRIKTMNKQAASTPRNLLLAERFYGFDTWLQFEDIPYQGFQYDVFGGIPDQYALGYGHDLAQTRSEQPLFLFFITMAGHQPWFPQAPLLSDWRDLDSIQTDPLNLELDSAAQANLYLYFESRLRDGVKMRYFDALGYDFAMMDQFMTQQADSNAIFILMGDHQPPEIGMDWRYNFSTPVHIVSRDRAWLQRFSEAGFVPGLYVEPKGNQPVQHEGLMSLLLTRLLAHYGQGQPTLPWLPEGIRVVE